MERNYKITIPEPCHENWDKMTPKDNGRFCISCSKTVIDFSTMLPEEIQHFFIQNQNNKICGRFENWQLETIQIKIPSKVLYTQTNYHKIFLLALFIAMGTTLFSCADKDGNKKKINKIEVVDNTEQNQDEQVVSSCYGHEIESKKSKKIRRDNAIIMGGIMPPDSSEAGNFKYHIIYSQTDLDVLPVPENGMKQFYKFFNKNYTASTKGKIAVLFVVEEDGSLSNFNIVQNTPKEIGEEAIRILNTGPKWIPGKRKNHNVRSSYTLSISL
jgi:hypothetical protein